MKKNISFSFVQGRLSKKTAGIFQYFPINDWQDEIIKAAKLGFDGIEWIISDLSNPIFNKYETKRVLNLCKLHNLKISSISLDLFMHDPIYLMQEKKYLWLINNIMTIVDTHKIKRVSFPIEESCSILNDKDAKTSQERLSIAQKKLNKKNKVSVSIETDLSPKNLLKFLTGNKLRNIGITFDTGNVIANGYEIENYLNIFKEKIYGIHIKDRGQLFSSTVLLGKGEVPFSLIFSQLKTFKNLRDITLQSYRSDKNYIEDLKKNFKYIMTIFNQYNK